MVHFLYNTNDGICNVPLNVYLPFIMDSFTYTVTDTADDQLQSEPTTITVTIICS